MLRVTVKEINENIYDNRILYGLVSMHLLAIDKFFCF